LEECPAPEALDKLRERNVKLEEALRDARRQNNAAEVDVVELKASDNSETVSTQV
jgi:hypothetical protein